MAQDFVHYSDIGTYIPYHFNAAQASALVSSDHTHGSFLGSVVIGTAGVNDVITLANGAGNVFAVIKPVAGKTYEFNDKLNFGLYVQIAGDTIGDYCINALPMAV
jgi:hypothetical protein